MSRWFALCVFLASTATILPGCGGGSAPPAEKGSKPAVAPEPEKAPEKPPEKPSEAPSNVTIPKVEMRTSMGVMRIELYRDKAPKTVDNFLSYAREGFYDGTIFHRVVKGFVIQGGGFTSEMVEKKTHPPIENEAANGLRNLRGTLSMARTQDPQSATSQFFVNTKDNPALDYHDSSVRGFGYAVFGKVVEGLDVLDAIEKVSTTKRGPYDDVPAKPVVIESVRIVS